MSSIGFQILRSSDAGAPTLNGVAGSLINVLDALLDIGGSDAYWAKAFTGTNKAAYRAANGDRYYLRVDDSNAQYGAVRGYATMTDVDTGTGQFPNGTQQTNWSWFKSNTADATARTYLGIATDRFFLLLVNGGWSGSGQDLYFFGDPIKANSSDVGAAALSAYPGTSIGSSGLVVHGDLTNAFSNYVSAYTAASNNSRTMIAMALSADGATAAAAGKFFTSQPSSNARVAAYNEIQCLPIFIGSNITGASGKMRGRLPHVFVTINDGGDSGLAAGDTFTDDAGATYQLCWPGGTTVLSGSYPYLAIMTSNSERAGL